MRGRGSNLEGQRSIPPVPVRPWGSPSTSRAKAPEEPAALAVSPSRSAPNAGQPESVPASLQPQPETVGVVGRF